MNLELTLLELNDLYVATSRYATKCADELKEYGNNISSITYFKNEVRKAEALRDKIQTAMNTECKVLDEAIEYVRNYKVSNAEADEDALQKRDYARFTEYADKLAAEQYDTEREQLKSRKLFTLNQNR